MLTVEQQDRLNLAINITKQVQERLKRCRKKEIPVDFSFELTNTGIVEIAPNPGGWRTYVDLGGKSISIHIVFPNTKTLVQAQQDEYKRLAK